MRNVISRIKRRRFLAVIPVLAAIASVGGYTTLGSKAGSPTLSLSSKGISLAQARAAEIPTYYPGDSAEGNALNVILRGYNRSPIRDIDFIYGDCAAAAETGCAPPIEVQVWPACVRSLSMYDGSPGALTAERTTLRGAPAAFLENGQRLEIQTGIVTIVIFARDRDEALSVASALRGLNVNLPTGKPFPPPAKGAVEGSLSCS